VADADKEEEKGEEESRMTWGNRRKALGWQVCQRRRLRGEVGCDRLDGALGGRPAINRQKPQPELPNPRHCCVININTHTPQCSPSANMPAQ